MPPDLPVGPTIDWTPANPPGRVQLRGSHVLLRPLDPVADAGALYAASHSPDGDAASRRAAERFGFSYEGIFHQHFVVKGRRSGLWTSSSSIGAEGSVWQGTHSSQRNRTEQLIQEQERCLKVCFCWKMLQRTPSMRMLYRARAEVRNFRASLRFMPATMVERTGGRTIFGRAPLLSGFSAALASFALASNVSAASEQVTSFPIAPASRARAMTAGPDGNLWFVAVKPFSAVDETIGRLTPGGAVTEFPLPSRSYETNVGPDIVAGLDGNLWFVEYGGKRLGRSSLDGQVTEFPLPGADSRASAIASDSDGALWFTDEAASKIGRLEGGAITEFPLPPGAGPAGIVEGPDGNIWFTEKSANKIGRITPSGFMSDFQVPTPGSLPKAITVGPDGNLWFTEEGASQVARITPAGEITEFSVPVSTGTEAIVAGPAGDIWFSSNVYLGSITPSGQVAAPYCLDRGCRLPVASLAVGPEGDLWFGGGVEITEGGGGSATLKLNAPGVVGKFVPPPLTVAIGPNARAVANRKTDLRISCEGAAAGARCSGILQLTRRVRRRGSGSRRMREVVLAHRRYKMFTGESRRIPLRLTQQAMKMLPRHGSMSVLATAKAQGHIEAVQSTTLSRRRYKDN